MKVRRNILIVLLAASVVAGGLATSSSVSAQVVTPMELPEIITRLPEVALPVPSTTIKGNLLQSEHGQLVFFQVLKDIALPTHSHKGQWGTVLQGSIELTIGGVTRAYGSGNSYYIPASVPHSAKIPAGAIFIEFFEEPDRYKRK